MDAHSIARNMMSTVDLKKKKQNRNKMEHGPERQDKEHTTSVAAWPLPLLAANRQARVAASFTSLVENSRVPVKFQEPRS